MLKTAFEVLNEIENNDFKAYIVGGYARDKYLSIESTDVDICTSATPKQLVTIFREASLKNEEYGSIIVIHKGVRFEITTFRKELKYKNARKPIEIEYIDSLEEDLKRRDFTMNTLCIDKNNNMIDHHNAIEDINKKLIKTVGDPDNKFSEDALRILRALRFLSQLDFDLEEKTEQAIINNKESIELLTKQRVKEELDKLFTGKNPQKALDKIIELDLERLLNINGLKDVEVVSNNLAMWAQLDIDINAWPFSKNEKNTIKTIRKLMKKKETQNMSLKY
jgi:tRNA nucleotidyltransferase (CCA-adding enzyme)